MRLFRTVSSTVGLDVGSACIRAVALTSARGEWSLVAAGEAGIDRQHLDVRPLAQRLLDDLGLRRANVTVAVPAQAAIVRRFRIPVGDGRDLDRRVGLEAEEHLQAGPEEITLSYQLLDPPSSDRDRGDLDEVEVLFGAARRTDVADRAALVTGRGRAASVADVDGLALANLYTLSYPDHAGAALLLHVGHRSTVLSLVEHGHVVTTRGIDVGAGAFGSASDLATAIRQGAGIRPEHRSAGGATRIMLSGGASAIAGLSDHLAAEFGMSVELVHPLRRIRTTATSRGAEHMGPAFALATGLALRRKGDR